MRYYERDAHRGGLDVQGQGGTDTLTVDFLNGSPFTNLSGLVPGGPGIIYDGGTEADLLQLVVSGGTFLAANETYQPTGNGDANIFIDAGFLQFSNLEPVIDSVPATNFTVDFSALPVPPGLGPFDVVETAPGRDDRLQLGHSLHFLPSGSPFCCGEPGCHLGLFGDWVLQVGEHLQREMNLRQVVSVDFGDRIGVNYHPGVTTRAGLTDA